MSLAGALRRWLAQVIALCVLVLLVVSLVPVAVEAVSPFVERQLIRAVTPRPSPSCLAPVPGCPAEPGTGVGAAAS